LSFVAAGIVYSSCCCGEFGVHNGNTIDVIFIGQEVVVLVVV
jgi:hypothetical protein